MNEAVRYIKDTDTLYKADEPFYFMWCQMRRRCRAYSQYVEKGITVCTEWMDFKIFQQWALATFIKGCSLDREKTDQGYNPSNCRWVDKTVQARNTTKRKNASSKYLGVSWVKTNSAWNASIRINKKLKFLGYHSTELDAAIARDTYIIENQLEHFTLNDVL